MASALAQDFPPGEREILVVDDGSTDDTAARLRKFGNAIRYLYKANGGQASAFNCGFQHTRGEVVALLDADDVWLPEKLSRIREAFERNPDAGMAYHRMYWWDGASETEADRYFIAVSGRVPESRGALLKYPMVGTSCLAFRRAALEKLLPVPEALRSQADAFLTALIIFMRRLLRSRITSENTGARDEPCFAARRTSLRIGTGDARGAAAEISTMAAQERPRPSLGGSARLFHAMEKSTGTMDFG